jgi:hypothetical protein
MVILVKVYISTVSLNLSFVNMFLLFCEKSNPSRNHLFETGAIRTVFRIWLGTRRVQNE